MLGKAIITLVFDDNDPTIYTEAYTRMAALGLKGTHACITGTIGNANLLSIAQVQEMYNAGWAIVNHTRSHVDLTTYGVVANAVADVANGKTDLEGRGWTAASHILIPPNNGMNETILGQITTTALMATTVTTGGLNTANSIRFDLRRIRRRGVGNNSVQTIKDWIDDAIVNNQHLHLNFHKISNAGTALDYPPADFQQVIEHVKARQNSGELDVYTMKELYDRYSGLRGPATRPLVRSEGNSSLYFSGSANYVTISDSASLGFSGTQPISIIAKVNVTDAATRRVLVLGLEIMIRTNGTSKVWEFLLNSFTTNDRVTAGAIIPGRWQVVTGVYDGTEMKLYVDKRLVGRVTPTGSYVDPGGAWKLSHESSEQFKGYMKDVRVFNVGLTHQQIVNYVDHNTIPSGQVLAYNFTEGSGTTLTDSSGNSNNGTITGATWSTNIPTQNRQTATNRQAATGRQLVT